jgi:hypothetical protein
LGCKSIRFCFTGGDMVGLSDRGTELFRLAAQAAGEESVQGEWDNIMMQWPLTDTPEHGSHVTARPKVVHDPTA